MVISCLVMYGWIESESKSITVAPFNGDYPANINMYATTATKNILDDVIIAISQETPNNITNTTKQLRIHRKKFVSSKKPQKKNNNYKPKPSDIEHANIFYPYIPDSSPDSNLIKNDNSGNNIQLNSNENNYNYNYNFINKSGTRRQIRTVVTSIGFYNNLSTFDNIISNHINYASLNGYDYFLLRKQLYNYNRKRKHGPMQKALLLYNLMYNKTFETNINYTNTYTHVIWIDFDAIFLNDKLTIDKILNYACYIHTIPSINCNFNKISLSISGDWNFIINAGA